MQRTCANDGWRILPSPHSTLPQVCWPCLDRLPTLVGTQSPRLADNLTGSGTITGTAGNFYDAPQVLVVTAATSGSSTNPATAMDFWLLECSGTSTECYANQPEVIFYGQGFMATPSTSLSGTWGCMCSMSSPCYGQSGALIATHQ